ncbi:DUF4175 family protein [Luteimonas sp. JM171]|uniref:DUF4175 family protein n=1 Tax=Luteimonas sp. JM171 TaxID=1896164 RepID=UPI000856D98E|nr:DUF4175 family protein [Luteimonas sp. JM171]AOH36343.1 hypothetical protein BGP89_08230 [Luteimonas sp. JM171]
MSAALRLRSTLRAARLRVVLASALVALPPVVALVVVLARMGASGAAAMLGIAGLAVAAVFIVLRARPIGVRWLAGRLDATRPDMEDSAALLFAHRSDISALQRLQRERLRRRVADAPMPDLRPDWPRRRIALSCGLSLLAIALAVLWPQAVDRDGMRVAPTARHTAGAPQLQRWKLQVQPPAYTGLESYEAEALDTQAPAGSQLVWTLRFHPQPPAAELRFHDGSALALEQGEGGWTASHRLDASTLYRIVPEGASAEPAPPLHRLDAIADEPPKVRVVAPAQSLSTMSAGQRRWTLEFEATDDYGVAADARLHITLAKGTGENITFAETSRSVHGSGPATRRRFEVTLDPIGLGIGQGEDLVARLEVRDNRSPRPHFARSPSLILRWPAPPPPDVDGLDALAREVLPAYFRSQRQIIIDAEALLEERPALEPERFLARSDALGVDQRVLRLRYGQFMGEEAEDGPAPPPVDDAAPPPTTLPIDDFGQAPAASAEQGGESGPDRSRTGVLDLHDHDHEDGLQPREAAAFGSMEGVLEEYAHLHDLPGAATLLAPRTRETLRRALGEMWQSELALRQGDPARALPFAYRALAFIQQVREADRIYLARTGSQLPPIDESRRLGGDRDGIGRRPLPPSNAPAPDDELAQAWRALAGDPGAGALDVDALEHWLGRNQGRLDDPLELVAALDAVRNDPGCQPCQSRLRAVIWTVLARPAARPALRSPEEGDTGRRYLEALQEEER